MFEEGLPRVWVIERLLGLVNLVAFASFAAQWRGLISENGISPVRIFQERVLKTCWGSHWHEQHSLREWCAVMCSFPSVTWVCHSDLFLAAIVWGGLLSSCFVIIDKFTLAALVICYSAYLSLKTVSEPFLSLQMDANIIELNAILIASYSYSGIYPYFLIITLRFHIFRVMLACGLVKIFGSSCWKDFTAMCFHYNTQPLPNPLSAYFHYLPIWVHKISTVATLVIELIVPFFVWLTSFWRKVALLASLKLLLMINMTGNYGFLGLMTAVVSICLTEDSHWGWLTGELSARPVGYLSMSNVGAIFGATVVAMYNIVCLVPLIKSAKYIDCPISLVKVQTVLRQFRVCNYYGKFGSMRSERYELVIMGTADGMQWQEIDFRFKPGSVSRRLPYLVGHLPRLDWRAWFLPSKARQHKIPYWWDRLLIGIVSNRPEVVALLDQSTYPFKDAPPRVVKTLIYQYELSNPAEAGCSGRVWHRRLIGPYGEQVYRLPASNIQ